MGVLPSKSLLAEATVLVLSETQEMLKAADINTKVAFRLKIPKEVLEIEDANCTGTEFAYQMRWIRTDLKKKGIIQNPQRVYWSLNFVADKRGK
ncbi:winged helix-turn-helix domain-containing protein [Intestinibacillus massiliensis]|uniref:winged helix-turn-helix domain-containing protein n=1 Tax=Intestinibacillus massiliensis TaxID=1871029 RepID=UPI000B36162E|nr:winged helix-turn-helix domain-containing protein [Intestinibacillus massiliensis]